MIWVNVFSIVAFIGEQPGVRDLHFASGVLSKLMLLSAPCGACQRAYTDVELIFGKISNGLMTSSQRRYIASCKKFDVGIFFVDLQYLRLHILFLSEKFCNF